MTHSFDKDIATKYGILEAILLNHLLFWIEKNKANETNYFDGYYWTFNSVKAFKELFPYASERQIQNALKKLKEEHIIQTGNYNENAYDRTLWYAFTNKGYSIMQKCKMDYADLSNGLCENVEPIPDNKPYIEKDNNKLLSTKKFQKPTIEDIRNYCYERNNGINAEYFYDFYEARNWMVGKNKMKDWKACIRTWERNNKTKQPEPTKPTSFGPKMDEYGGFSL